MDETNSNTPPQSGDDFVKKPVESPILATEVRQKVISAADPVSERGFKAFYRANKLYFWAIFVGAVIIAVLAYFAFRKTNVAAPTEANVEISVDTVGKDDTVASGSEGVYRINIKNNDTQTLTGMELELVYADGMSYASSQPDAENLSGTKFSVADLSSGQTAAVIVKIKINGNVNDEKKLGIKLHYSYKNFSSEFIKEADKSVRLVASDVLVEIQGPTEANNAQLVVYTVKYQNNSDADVNNSRVTVTYPDGFVYAAADPAPDIGSDTWSVGTLAKGSSGEIKIQGSFNSVNPGETKVATAEFLVLDSNGQAQVQNSNTFQTTISNLPLLVTQDLEPTRANGVIKPGENLTFSIRYQNNASTAATGVNIVVTLDSRVVDSSSLRAESGQINNNTITWNASTVSKLENLLPNESGQLSFSLKINNPAVKDSSKNLTLVSNIKIKSNEYDNYYQGNSLSLKVSSPSSIGETLSFVSGQLPPQVGSKSVYKVKLSLTNSTNDYTGGVLTAYLPSGSNTLVANSYNSSESGNVTYDSSTGKLTWNVGSLSANTGRFSQARSLEFQIQVNPSASQVNRAVDLVKNIGFTAKDAFTGQDVSISADDISTNDLSGSGYGNGIVQQ